MKALTHEMVTFEIHPLHEDTRIVEALSEKETGADHSEYIKKVIADGGYNPWLWCTIKVVARFKELEGTAYLGQCAYESENDFKKGGYYEQMQDEAFEELKNKVSEIINALI